MQIFQGESESLKDWYDRVGALLRNILKMECSRDNEAEIERITTLATTTFISRVHDPKLKLQLVSSRNAETTFDNAFEWAELTNNLVKEEREASNKPVLCGQVKALTQHFQNAFAPQASCAPPQTAQASSASSANTASRATHPEPVSTPQNGNGTTDTVQVAQVRPQPGSQEQMAMADVAQALQKISLSLMNNYSGNNNNRSRPERSDYGRQDRSEYQQYPRQRDPSPRYYNNSSQYYDYNHGYNQGYNNAHQYNQYGYENYNDPRTVYNQGRPNNSRYNGRNPGNAKRNNNQRRSNRNQGNRQTNTNATALNHRGQ